MPLNVASVRLLVSVLFACSLGCSDREGFDRVCGFYRELAKSPTAASYSDQQRTEYVRARVSEELGVSEPAREHWNAVADGVSAGSRYRMFRGIANDVAKGWECARMEILFD
jgi:hypothetical protein